MLSKREFLLGYNSIPSILMFGNSMEEEYYSRGSSTISLQLETGMDGS